MDCAAAVAVRVRDRAAKAWAMRHDGVRLRVLQQRREDL
jgi:hypothetical protein